MEFINRNNEYYTQRECELTLSNMKGFGDHEKFQKKLIQNSKITNLKEQIIQKAFSLHSKGKITEAKKYYQYFLDKGFKNSKLFTNYGVLLRGLGQLKEAELFTRQAIELNPDYTIAYSNLGGILIDLGNLKEAELATRQAIELKPDYAIAYSNIVGILKDIGNIKEAE